MTDAAGRGGGAGRADDPGRRRPGPDAPQPERGADGVHDRFRAAGHDRQLLPAGGILRGRSDLR